MEEFPKLGEYVMSGNLYPPAVVVQGEICKITDLSYPWVSAQFQRLGLRKGS